MADEIPPDPALCEVCRKPFKRWNSLARVCGYRCAAKVPKIKRKTERARDRASKEAQKTISQLESECRVIVQHIARIRDRNDGCISCHMGPNYSGVWHGSHYRAHGGCSSLQMHLWNIHKSCAQCNLFKNGNREGYVRGLVAKHGQERVDWLDCQPKSRKFSREYLQRFKVVMRKRLNRLAKRSESL